MRESHHPHPHIDPRQPRDGTRPGTNPPVLVWKPPDTVSRSRLVVARDPALRDRVLDLGLAESAYLPESALLPGRYYWQWSGGDAVGDVFSFEITPDATVLEVPPVADWLRRFGSRHPRIWIRAEQVEALRASRIGARVALWQHLQATADRLLGEPHELAEPPFLPDREQDYQGAFNVWYRILGDSRRFVHGALMLGLAYLGSGEARYGRAACQRLHSVSHWDPEGATHIGHNDEAHMSIIWHGAIACDWVWDQFTEEERAVVVAQFRRRGEITFEHMHDRGTYGVTRFDNHAGREIIFLALIGLVFHEQIPEATRWLEWLRPVLCGIWPAWSGDDGAWAQGPTYALPYVEIMTMFASALRTGADINLYRRPFWENHIAWRQWMVPAYGEWLGFGDGSDVGAATCAAGADLAEVIDQEGGGHQFGRYITELRTQAARGSDAGSLHGSFRPSAADRVSPLRYLAAPAAEAVERAAPEGVLRVFPQGGWAAFRTDLHDPSRDLALLFRSSPFGSISHSHANHNDIILHVAGRVLAMPSGYYDGYGSDHHVHWMWHTKSHNCVTLSDAPQIMDSHDAVGAIENAFEDDRLAYLRGTADAAYRDRAQRCRRHVLLLKPHCCFVLIDEFVARPDVASALQWNLHSWAQFQVEEAARSFLLEREGSSLAGHVMYHHNGFFSLGEGWDPAPFRTKPDSQWQQQYHLRFTCSGLSERQNLGVVLCPGHGVRRRAEVRCERDGNTEIAHLGEDMVLVRQGATLAYGDVQSEALAAVLLGGRQYEVHDAGVKLV